MQPLIRQNVERTLRISPRRAAVIQRSDATTERLSGGTERLGR